MRRALGVTAFGVNAYTADQAGDTLIEPHDETSPGAGGHEELYLTATGRASFTVADQKVDVPMGTMLLVEPGTQREAVAAEDSTTVLVIGGRPGAAMPPSPFEYWYSAIPAEPAGDFERAYAIVAEGLEHWPNHGSIHYALGCYAARFGRPRAGARAPAHRICGRPSNARLGGRGLRPGLDSRRAKLCRAVMLGVRSGYASAKVAGSGPLRSPRSSPAILSISCSESSKSNRSKFSRIRSGVTDFGITMLPS